MSSFIRGRIYIIYTLIVLAFIIVVGRLYLVQIVYHQDYRAKALRQYEPSGNSETPFDRGLIYFTKKDGGSVAAANIISGYYLAVQPHLIKNATDAYQRIASIVNISQADFISKATKADDPFEIVMRRLTKAEGEAIAKLSISGVAVYPEQWRYYPSDGLAAQVLGFVGFSGDSYNGRYGIERQFDGVLSRSNSYEEKNAFVQLFSDFRDRLLKPSSTAGDVYLTIEPNVESQTQKILSDAIAKYKAKEGGAIVMDPKTGAVYAMNSVPTFNPNTYSEVKNISVLQNPIVENSYEMGSVIKPLTVTAGIDSGAINVDSTYNDTGSRTYDGKTISNFDLRGRGVVEIQEILSQSLNTGVAWIMEKLTPEKFTSYFRSFGIGYKTGIELPNETAGITQNIDAGRMIEYATASFGQGIAMSPLSAIRALAVIANGGYLVTPYVVDKVVYEIGGEKKTEPQVVQVLKPETSKKVTTILVNVVDKALMHGKAKNPNYTVAAKTGTAQIADPVNGGYMKNTYLHSFFGYFPAYDPKFIVFLYIKEPQGVTYASETLTQPFLDLTSYLINYYDIHPDR